MNALFHRPSLARACLLLCALLALPAHGHCVGGVPGRPEQPQPPALTEPAAREALRALVDEALQRSQAVGAARLLADAAAADVDEARAGALPRAALDAGSAWIGSRGENLLDRNGTQGRAGVSLGAPLYDSGRVAELSGWRERLAEAARYGALSAQEQVALQALALALERSHHLAQLSVYADYAEQVACLVGALERIVAGDRGRASELVQAHKTQGQAALASEQARSLLRQAEIRLRRFVGDAPLPAGDVAAALPSAPPLDATLAEAGRASDIAQLAAQASAQERYARVVASANRPQLNWALSGSRAVGTGRQTAWSAGLTLNVPLHDPASAPAQAAAQRRAEAAQAQHAEALDARRGQIAAVHEQAAAAYERARRTAEVLFDSERVRDATFTQWQQLGRRSLFDVIAAESEHVGLRLARVDALHEGQQASALLWSLGLGVPHRLAPP